MSKQRKPKIKKFNGPIRQIGNDVTLSSSQDDTEEAAADRFERELLWCVEQLQLGLENQKADSRQALEAVKVLRILQSDKTPLIKKRQAMRNTFGDYRQKMKAEEKRMASKMRKLEVTSGDAIAGKSVFYRKSSQSHTPSQDGFIEMNGANCMVEDLKSMDQSEESSNGIVQSELNDDFKIIFNKTENEFKFNFNISTSNDEDTTTFHKNHPETNQMCTTSSESKESQICEGGKEFKFGFDVPSMKINDETLTAEKKMPGDLLCCGVADSANIKDQNVHMEPDLTSFVGEDVHNYFVNHDRSSSNFKFNFSVS